MRYGTQRATSLVATPNLAPLVQAQQMPQQHRSPVHLATADDTDYEDMARSPCWLSASMGCASTRPVTSAGIDKAP
ncbi:hypothetical protein [Stenotrophomonas maltophilia]|uniref:hypothetical protein n=1 Tax=Stenotrophomonas maltophilia TaxID=40324 RepID=UPI000A3FB887|nr:hypothetical protein [Stenotrophomonas maltophilia]